MATGTRIWPDGFADLAIGIPNESIRRIGSAGAVQVLFGSPTGLTALDQIWHQGKPGVPGTNGAGDMFGSELVVGDFDADGFADLAVGVAGEDIGSVQDAGFVAVLRGSAAGLTSAGARAIFDADFLRPNYGDLDEAGSAVHVIFGHLPGGADTPPLRDHRVTP